MILITKMHEKALREKDSGWVETSPQHQRQIGYHVFQRIVYTDDPEFERFREPHFNAGFDCKILPSDNGYQLILTAVCDSGD